MRLCENGKGDDRMVSWIWIPASLFAGVCIGIMLICLVSANDRK